MKGYTIDFKTSRTDVDAMLIDVEFLLDEDEHILDDHLTTSRDNVDFGMIDKFIDIFNQYNNNLIQKYDYTIFSDTKCELIILFKHVLKKMHESQKYVYYEVQLDKEGKKLTFQIKNGAHPAFPIKDRVEFIPIRNLVIFYDICDKQVPQSDTQDRDRDRDQNDEQQPNTQRVLSMKVCYKKVPKTQQQLASTSMDHSEMFHDMIKDVVECTFKNLKNHVSVVNGRIELK